jgi:hypothetical protein
VAAALALTLTAPGCGGGNGDGPTGPLDRIVFIIPNPSTIAADGSETSQLIIHVVTLVTGDPIEGAVVRLETDLGVFVDTGTRRHEVTTGGSGFADSALRGDGQAGTATVSARSGGFAIVVQIVLE